MRAIRLKIKQPTANYRVEMYFKNRYSYPLPPYSTVIGMLHNLCGFKEYHKMRLAVQGKFASTTMTLNNYYYGGIYAKDRKNTTVVEHKNGRKENITRGKELTELLTDIELVIYIVPENEEDFDVIYENCKNPSRITVLGRAEDVADFEKVEIVELEPQDDSEYSFFGNAWVPTNLLRNCNGTIYNVNKKYTINQKGVRIFDEVIPSVFAGSDSIADIKEGFDDEKNETFVVLA